MYNNSSRRGKGGEGGGRIEGAAHTWGCGEWGGRRFILMRSIDCRGELIKKVSNNNWMARTCRRCNHISPDTSANTTPLYLDTLPLSPIQPSPPPDTATHNPTSFHCRFTLSCLLFLPLGKSSKAAARFTRSTNNDVNRVRSFKAHVRGSKLCVCPLTCNNHATHCYVCCL